MADIAISHLSTSEELAIQGVTLRRAGIVVDPTTYAVSIALKLGDTQPADSEWTVAQWAGGTIAFAAGSATPVGALTAGAYWPWWKASNGTATIVRRCDNRIIVY